MPRIRVRPERLRELSQQLSRAAGDVTAISRMMSGAANSLDWEVRQQGAVASATHEAVNNGHRLAERLTAMSKYLTQRSQALEAADNAAEGGAHTAAKGLLQRMADAWHHSVAQVKQELQRLLGLGAIIAPTAVPLPVLDGLNWLRRMRPDLFKRKPSQPNAPQPTPVESTPVRPEEKPVPSEAKPPPTPTPVDSHPAPPPPVPTEHGPFPAKETTDTNIGAEIDAPFQNAPGHRSVDEYNLVLDQFGVDTNPRYAEWQNGTTFCNVFVRDATRAMGCEIPPGTAQSMASYLHQQQDGWREVSADEAQRLADQGKPAVAAYAGSPSESGHVAMIRPHKPGDQTPVVVAQAGTKNANYLALTEGFGPQGKREVHFYVHE